MELPLSCCDFLPSLNLFLVGCNTIGSYQFYIVRVPIVRPIENSICAINVYTDVYHTYLRLDLLLTIYFNKIEIKSYQHRSADGINCSPGSRGVHAKVWIGLSDLFIES
jgi:hypothetical protein